MCFQKQKIEIWIFWKITCLGHLNFQIIYIPNQRINILSLPSSYFSPAGLILTLLCLCFYTWNLWRLPLTVEEFTLLLSHLDSTDYGNYVFKLCLIVTLELGLRRGEVAGLEWSNIDFEKKKIKINNNLIYTNTSVQVGTPKTIESERSISVSNDLLELFKTHKKKQNLNRLEYGENYIKNKFNNREYDFIFTWESGKYIHPNYYTLKFNRLVNNSGIDKKIRFHDLRHSNATLLLQEGVDFKVIQERLGHSDINTTLNIYSHVTDEMQKSATDKISNLIFSSKLI